MVFLIEVKEVAKVLSTNVRNREMQIVGHFKGRRVIMFVWLNRRKLIAKKCGK